MDPDQTKKITDKRSFGLGDLGTNGDKKVALVDSLAPSL